MVLSERFERDVGRALRGAGDRPESERLTEIGALFLGCLGYLPAALTEEIRAWYADLYASDDPRLPDLDALAARFSAIIDIFDRAYDPRRTPLEDDEWGLVRSLVNEHSPEMSLSLLEYVMQLLMDRGEIG